MDTQYLAVDLGGTNLRLALLSESGDILEQKILSSELVHRPEDLIAVLKIECERMATQGSERSIQGLALGIPGLVDFAAGKVLQSPHFPLWQNVALRDELQPFFPFPVIMDNDANQAALGEAWKGAAQGWKDFVLITLGTGVGGGIVLNGDIFRGPSGFAGEIGHIIIDRQGLPDAIGIRGTLESWASQSGLKRQVASLQNQSKEIASEILSLNVLSPSLPEELSRLAQTGCSAALEIWRNFGDALGCGIASLAHTLGIFRFVIGGGLAQAWDYFSASTLIAAQNSSYPRLRDRFEIHRADLGSEAGLRGAVPLIKKYIKNQ